VPYGVLALSVSAVYSRILDSPFLFDDSSFIDRREFRAESLGEVLDALFTPRVERPLGYFFFAVNYWMGGQDPFSYHLVNIGIHAVNAWLVYLLAGWTLAEWRKRGMGGSRETAFFIALLWALNPIQTMAVTYMIQRLASLAALFALVSLTCYVKGRRTPGWESGFWYAMAIASGLAGLGVKQNVAVLPLLVLAHEILVLQPTLREGFRRTQLWIAGGVVALAAIGIVYLGDAPLERIRRGYRERDFGPGERMLTECRVMVYYGGLTLWPAPERLNLDYDWAPSRGVLQPPTTALALLGIVGVLALAAWQAGRLPRLAYGVAWYFLNLLIESTIYPLDLVFEHRVYLSSISIVSATVLLVGSLSGGRGGGWPARIALTGIAAWWGAWTVARNEVWRVPVKLFQDTVRKSPGKARAHANLGAALQERGDLDASIGAYTRSLELDPDQPRVWNNRGMAKREKGDFKGAIEDYDISLSRNPLQPDVFNNRGDAKGELGDHEGALADYQKSIDLNPLRSETYSNRGKLLTRRGDRDGALRDYRRAIELDPRNAAAYNNRGVLWFQSGRLEEALFDLNRAIALKPDYSDAYFNRGTVRGRMGDMPGALEDIRRSVELRRR